MQLNSVLLREARQKRGWTQAVLCEMAGFETSTVYRVEKTGRASPGTVDKLAKAFKMETGVFLQEFGAISEACPNRSSELGRPIKQEFRLAGSRKFEFRITFVHEFQGLLEDIEKEIVRGDAERVKAILDEREDLLALLRRLLIRGWSGDDYVSDVMQFSKVASANYVYDDLTPIASSLGRRQLWFEVLSEDNAFDVIIGLDGLYTRESVHEAMLVETVYDALLPLRKEFLDKRVEWNVDPENQVVTFWVDFPPDVVHTYGENCITIDVPFCDLFQAGDVVGYVKKLLAPHISDYHKGESVLSRFDEERMRKRK